MSIENTSNLFPEGEYILAISDVPSKSERKGFVFWDFVFTTTLDGQIAPYGESIPIWLCGRIFKALGYPEVKPGSFDVEPTLALGKRLKVKIVHETVKDVLRARMKDIVLLKDEPKPLTSAADIPF